MIFVTRGVTVALSLVNRPFKALSAGVAFKACCVVLNTREREGVACQHCRKIQMI